MRVSFHFYVGLLVILLACRVGDARRMSRMGRGRYSGLSSVGNQIGLGLKSLLGNDEPTV